jgi:hypothetical protein
MPEQGERDVSEAERDALHDMQLAVEHVYRGYGALLDFHHHLGRAMGKLHDAEGSLREAGHETVADELRDRHLPAGAIGDKWTYELVDEFRSGFLRDVTEFTDGVRADLVDGENHVTEREQQRAWRERAESDAWRRRD